MIIPLDQRRRWTQVAQSLAVERPNRVSDGLVVGVDEVLPVIAMPGQVNLTNPLVRQFQDELPWVEILISCADVDVVHVKEQFATGQETQFREKLRFAHAGRLPLHVRRNVLQHNGTFQNILH